MRRLRSACGVLLLLVGCEVFPHPLVGSWQGFAGVASVRLVVEADGRFSLTLATVEGVLYWSGEYETDGREQGTVTLRYDDGAVEIWQYEISGDTLLVSFWVGTELFQMTLRRV